MAQSDIDTEAPLQDPQKNEYYRSIFNKYDRDHNGYLTVGELDDMIDSHECDRDIPEHVVRKIHQMSDVDRDGRIDFAEFVAMVNHPDLQRFFGRYVSRYVQMVVPRRRCAPDRLYEDEYTFCPPTVFMIVVSVFEIIFFCIDRASIKDPKAEETDIGTVGRALCYNPLLKGEVWRFVTYMFVHSGPLHLVFNLIAQIFVGIPLEMVHKWWRVLVVYFAGVVAGSLGTSVVSPSVSLVGASGGVYSLITAHLASIILNWKEMSYPIVQMLLFVIFIVSDLTSAICANYLGQSDDKVGYVAHFAGALAGLLVGLNVLRNLEETRTERIVWRASMVAYFALMVFAVIWNLAPPV